MRIQFREQFRISLVIVKFILFKFKLKLRIRYQNFGYHAIARGPQKNFDLLRFRNVINSHLWKENDLLRQ